MTWTQARLPTILAAKARITVLSSLLLAMGCQEPAEPPDPGPCSTWSVGPDWVLSARPDARFTATGGVFAIRSVTASRYEGGVNSDVFQGEVENLSDEVLCHVRGTVLVDGERAGSALVFAPPYDVGTAESAPCLGPGERGVFRASTSPGPGDYWTPEYARIEYRFEGERVARATPHSLTPNLIELHVADEDDPFGNVELELGTRAPLQNVWVTVVARDACGRVGIWWQSGAERALPPTFEVTIEGGGSTDPTERGLELLTFTAFTAP